MDLIPVLVGLITADQEDEKAKAEEIDKLMESLIGTDDESDGELGD